MTVLGSDHEMRRRIVIKLSASRSRRDLMDHHAHYQDDMNINRRDRANFEPFFFSFLFSPNGERWWWIGGVCVIHSNESATQIDSLQSRHTIFPLLRLIGRPAGCWKKRTTFFLSSRELFNYSKKKLWRVGRCD